MKLGFKALLDSLKSSQEGLRLTIPEYWMQGRTTYGGLSAALCLQAVYRQHPELPPIRSANIHFIGPVHGTVSIETRVLREGKSVCFIEAEMKSEGAVLTHAMFCFGKPRESKINQIFRSHPNYKSVSDSKDLFEDAETPIFLQFFECRLAKGSPPLIGSDTNEHLVWARLKEKLEHNPVSLLAIGDMPPPGVMPMFKQMAPTSSINWAVNFIQNNPSTKDDWWLLRSYAEDAQEGYSSQDMQMWNSRGELVITGRQSVAYFY